MMPRSTKVYFEPAMTEAARARPSSIVIAEMMMSTAVRQPPVLKTFLAGGLTG